MTEGTCEFCGKAFMKRSNNAKYCPDCRNVGQHICEKRKSEKKKEDRKRRKGKKSIADVMKFCAEYEKRTGRYLSYGKAAVMMEQGR